LTDEIAREFVIWSIGFSDGSVGSVGSVGEKERELSVSQKKLFANDLELSFQKIFHKKEDFE